MEIYWLLWYTQFFKKHSTKRFFVFGLLWSNRSRFRICCTSSFYMCVDLYLTQVLPLVLTVHRLGTKTIRKTISKNILLLVFKITVGIRGYFCYKMITSQNVSAEHRLIFFLFRRKVMFCSQDIQVFVFLTIP